ncbi:MAG: hypothetical protein WAZ98_03755 [Cyclobacteriaceae bacterium]
MNYLKESDFAINAENYQMLMGNYKAGNYPKEYVNEAAAQIHKLSVALGQYKDDLTEQEIINNSMAIDLKEMIEKFTSYAQISKCATAQLICSLVVINLEKILKNQNIDFTKLTKL